ncbi:hypothetical protein [Streptomyces sp. NPDC000134]|uniref:hypothetical protein n=1 Tax=Streptomyces sp. NPDC000134 TaxID=3364536 RepID=UPI003677958E
MRRACGYVTLLLCASLSACSTVSGGGGAGTLLKPTTAPSAAAGGTDLAGAALEPADVSGLAAAKTAGRPEVEAARSGCAPLAYALSGAAVGDPAATVVRRLSGEGVTVTTVLAEYRPGEALAAMDAIGTALDECADGFTATVDGDGREVGDVVPELAPEGTDQAMGWGASVRSARKSVPVKSVVLRVGDKLAYLSGTPTLPAAAIEAQTAKLSTS